MFNALIRLCLQQRLFVLGAALLLLIAAINFINMSTARAAMRRNPDCRCG